jgi:hypothetical protein
MRSYINLINRRNRDKNQGDFRGANGLWGPKIGKRWAKGGKKRGKRGRVGVWKDGEARGGRFGLFFLLSGT